MLYSFLNIKKIISYENYIKYILIIFLSIITSFLELVSFTSLFLVISSFFNETLNDNFIYNFIEHIPLDNTLLLFIIFIAIIFLKNIYTSFWMYSVFNLLSRCSHEIRTRIFDLKFKKNSKAIDNSLSKSIRNISITVEDFINYILYPFLTLISEVLLLVFITSVFLFVDIRTTLISFVFLLVSGLLIYLPIKGKFKSYSQIRQKNYNYFIGLLNYILMDYKVISSLNRSKIFKHKFYSSSIEEASGRKIFNFFRDLPRQLFEILIAIFIVFFFNLIKNDPDYINKLIFFGVVSIRLLPSFSRILSSISVIRIGKESINEILNEYNLSLINEECSENIKKVIKVQTLEIKNLSFKYKNSDQILFNSANLLLQKGKTYSIMGRSGVGKTTLINILMGFTKIYDGEILLNDKKINLINYDSIYGYLPQQINLLKSSILENIVVGMNNVSDYDRDNLKFAINGACLNEFIENLPNGIHSKVGELGNKISIGQKQRIGIARLLYYNPQILIFDEGFSALDEETEQYVFNFINKIKEDKIIIFITHDKDLEEKCDVKMIIKNNKLIKR